VKLHTLKRKAIIGRTYSILDKWRGWDWMTDNIRHLSKSAKCWLRKMQIFIKLIWHFIGRNLLDNRFLSILQKKLK